jgi:hypothetical protein
MSLFLTDKEGDPVLINDLSLLNLHEVMNKTTQEKTT